MKRSGVDTSLLAVKGEKSYTGRCVCLVDKTGQRTMRPSLEDAIRLQPEEVLAEQLNGVQWVVVNGYSYYGPGLMEATVAAARRAGCKVAMHLASFEIVRKFREPMSKLLSSGEIHAVFGEFIFSHFRMDNVTDVVFFFQLFSQRRRGEGTRRRRRREQRLHRARHQDRSRARQVSGVVRDRGGHLGRQRVRRHARDGARGAKGI